MQLKTYLKILNPVFISLLFVFTACGDKNQTAKQSSKAYKWKTETAGDYTYKYIENDPSKARFYTLDNGLTVILSPSIKEPRIQTFIAVKAGSKTDPSNHTGLAHYLEHMLFKGTDKFGSLDWEKEKVLLEEIENLYERYNKTTDEDERREIYKEIDIISGEAAKYAIANEYDKMMSGMGAKGTNAFTSFEQTVYTEDIPNNVITKYLAVQSERFRNPVFRLFHTELEAVYEEKNRSLDNDGNKVYEEIFRLLFPNNNYGKQTTIGTIEHLKNPSLIEIRNYFNDYYVPNNMGIIMAGDFDPDKVIREIDESFSYMNAKDVPEYVVEKEEEIVNPIISEVYGPEAERVMLGFRFPGAASEDAKMLSLIGEILTNGSAGLIDLNLVKKQKLLGAYAFPYVLRDYGTLILGGNPTQGQNLNEVKDLLLEEIEKLKTGDFSEDLITSIINNEKRNVLETNEDYTSRAYELMYNFVLETDWLESVTYVDWLSKITKQDVIDFANKYFNNNYVAVYKRQGEDKNVIKVEKPEITPIEVNRDSQSDFLIGISEIPENKIDPLWLDFDKDIKRANAGKYEVLAVENKDNSLFSLDYYFEMGSWNDELLGIAAGYLEYLGTQDKSAEDISTDFYKLASDFSIRVNEEDMSISISGLQENFKETVAQFDDLLKKCVADEDAMDAYIKRIQKSRENSKENKWQIMRGLQNYAFYGAENPFNSTLTNDELESLKAEDLVEVLHNLYDYNHKILYYGPQSAEDISMILKEIHIAPEDFAEIPNANKYVQQSQESNNILMAHYDMVQSEIFWLKNADEFKDENTPIISLFNQYFGGGMQSVVFQTIRESKALAYSTYAYYRNPSRKEMRPNFIAYVGAQSDKFNAAVTGMNELLSDLPESAKAIENAKISLHKKLESERITGKSIIYSYLSATKLGRNYDVRKKVYEQITKLDYEDLNNFFKEEISQKPFTYCILVGKNKLKNSDLNAIGKVKVLSLEDIFGY